MCPPSPLRFTPPPLPPSGVGSLHCAYGYKLSLTAAFLSAVNPQPPLAIPSRRCRYAALPPSIARTPYLSHVPPTHRGCSRLHSKPSAKPRPKLCARQSSPPVPAERDRFTYSEQPAAHGTEGSDIVLCKPCDKVLSLHKFHDTPLCSLLRVRCAPSRSTPTLPAVSLDRPSPHLTPRLDCKICVKGKRCCRKCQFSTNGNLTLTAAILPHILCI